MKKALVIALALVTVFTFFGCGASLTKEEKNTNNEILEGDEGIPEDEFIPANSFEERVGKDRFESYDEIIGLLKAPEAYAFVNIKGADEPVLVVATETFGGEEIGYRGAMEAFPYFIHPDGLIHAGSVFFTDSTGTPIAVSDDGIIYCAQHSNMTTLCLGDNGTDFKGIMCMKYVYTEYGADGKPDSFGGFIRNENTVVNNDGEAIAEDDEAAFKQAFDEYEKCSVIDFTLAR